MMCSKRPSSGGMCLVAATLLLLLPLGAVAFHHPSSHHLTVQTVRNYQTRLQISPFGGSGWDNDDFLSSLSEPYEDDSDGSGTELTRSMEPPAQQQQQQQIQQQQYQQQYQGTDPALAAATEALGRDQSAVSGYGAGYAGQQQPQAQPQAQQSQVQRQEVGALPLGWSAHFDPDSRQLYYYNVNDGTTQWERPASPPPPPPAMGGAFGGGGGGGGEDAAMFGGGQPILMQPQSQQVRPFGGPQPQATPGAASLPPEEARSAEEVPIDESIDGAELTADMKAKIKASHTAEEEASGGGQRFKELMERAKQAAASGGAGQQQQRMMQQQSSAPMAAQLPPDAANLPLDEQARLYREMFWRQKNPQVENYPTPQYQMNGIGIDGRKVGRNRDSDMISNSGDVYMAQLKRDSTTRNLARYAGDDAKANAVFHDAGIHDIQGPEENPYLKERRERERDMLETVPEEMLLFQEYDEQGGDGADAAGRNQQISYRDRLRQAQEQKRSQQ